MNDPAKPGANADKQLAAILASGGIVLGFIVYWSVQIQAVREMLELAYG